MPFPAPRTRPCVCGDSPSAQRRTSRQQPVHSEPPETCDRGSLIARGGCGTRGERGRCHSTPGMDRDELRRRALAASSSAPQSKPAEAKRTYQERSAAVRQYVLARENGTCEASQRHAPFQRPDSTPYLEPHHTRGLSDGGPDHPRWVGAICPNCHGEIHHGMNGEVLNQRSQEYLRGATFLRVSCKNRGIGLQKVSCS
jgi:hypothetical protein